jgi:hypothetical protein
VQLNQKNPEVRSEICNICSVRVVTESFGVLSLFRVKYCYSYSKNKNVTINCNSACRIPHKSSVISRTQKLLTRYQGNTRQYWWKFRCLCKNRWSNLRSSYFCIQNTDTEVVLNMRLVRMGVLFRTDTCEKWKEISKHNKVCVCSPSRRTFACDYYNILFFCSQF